VARVRSKGRWVVSIRTKIQKIPRPRLSMSLLTRQRVSTDRPIIALRISYARKKEVWNEFQKGK
jgi:hypothetical protein